MSLPSGLVERRAEFVSFSSSPTHPHTQLQPAVGPQLLGSSARGRTTPKCCPKYLQPHCCHIFKAGSGDKLCFKCSL